MRVREIFRHLREEHGNSNRTLARRASSLREFEKYLEEEGLVSKLQMHRIRIRYEKVRQPKLRANEVDRLLKSAGGKFDKTKTKRENLQVRDRAVLDTLYGSGLRVSELIGLRIDDIDLDSRILYIAGGKSGAAEVMLAAGAVPSLRKWLKYRDQVVNVKPEGKDYVFVSKNGRKINRRSVYRLVERVRKKSKLKKHVSPHTLRGSAGTALVANGARMVDAQHFLRHRNISTTQDYIGESAVDLEQVLRKHHPSG